MNFLKSISETVSQVVDCVSTPLMAALIGDVDMFVRCYCNGEDTTTTDFFGNTVLHVGASKNHRDFVRAVLLLCERESLWKVKNVNGKTPIEVAASQEVRDDIKMVSSESTCEKNLTSKEDVAMNSRLIAEHLAKKEKTQKVLLALDGGGTRGCILIQIMLAIDRAMTDGSFWDRVDWVGCTSTGSVAAATMETSGRDLEQLRRTFLREKDKWFMPGNAIIPKYEGKAIENGLRRELGEKPLSTVKKRIMITSTQCDSLPCRLILFRSYAPALSPTIYEKHGYLNPQRILLWKAVRCSTAAPTFFPAFNGLTDGALMANNPTIELLTDFFRLKKIENDNGVKNENRVACVISIGTGVMPPIKNEGIDMNLRSERSVSGMVSSLGKGLNMVHMFMVQSLNSDSSVTQSQEWSQSIGSPYFRFSPPLKKKVELDCCENRTIIDVLWQTETYIRNEAAGSIRILGEYLNNMNKE